MSNVWERFESIVDATEVSEAQDQFKPLEAGDYKCVLESIEPTENQNGLPMVKGKFKTIEGGRTIFYNQMLQNVNNPKMTAVNVAECVNFVSGLLDEEVEFQGLGHLAQLITAIPIGGEYVLNVYYGTKDLEMKFPKLKVLEACNAVEVLTGEVLDGDDSGLPF